MGEFDELKATQDAIVSAVGKVKADVEALHAQLDAIPVPGMTDVQKSALADVTASAKSILDSLSAVDALTPEPAPAPAPAPLVEPTPMPEPAPVVEPTLDPSVPTPDPTPVPEPSA